MKQELLKCLSDACFYGKRITELMPPLPKGMKPRHMHVIDTIHMLQEKQERVCIGDVSAAPNFGTVCVTALAAEHFVEKAGGRGVFLIAFAPLGLFFGHIHICQRTALRQSVVFCLCALQHSNIFLYEPAYNRSSGGPI